MLAMLNLLPSEAAVRLKNALQEWDETGSLTICEPCDCGSQVRHNNGGNYHSIIKLRRDSGRVFVKWDDTCELTPTPPWDETTETDAQEIIAEHSDWL